MHGLTDSATGIGVVAENTAGGTAFKADGKSTFSGQATFQGKATFARSAVLDAGGKSKLVKTGVSLSSTSYVLATLQTNAPGVYVRAAVPDPAAGTITIYLNANAPAGAKVAWFVVN
jgi:hypothetical protein